MTKRCRDRGLAAQAELHAEGQRITAGLERHRETNWAAAGSPPMRWHAGRKLSR
jgi:hypothetical protein